MRLSAWVFYAGAAVCSVAAVLIASTVAGALGLAAGWFIVAAVLRKLGEDFG